MECLQRWSAYDIKIHLYIGDLIVIAVTQKLLMETA